MYGVAWFLLRGRFGRTLRAVRDSGLAAASSGVDLARYKTLLRDQRVLRGSIAGSLLAIATTFVNPDTFPIALSIFLLVGVVVGGLGSFWPCSAPSSSFMQIQWAQRTEAVVPDFIPVLQAIDTDAQGAPAVAFGAVLILIMLAFPGAAEHDPGLVAGNSRLPSPALSERRSCPYRCAATSFVFHARSQRRDRRRRDYVECGPGVDEDDPLGGTSPLSGPPPPTLPLRAARTPYLKHVNARGGVNGRMITYKHVDDAYNPAQTVQATKRLVEQDKVFAIFNSLGTEHNATIRDYLEQARVPQLFVAMGATTFGRDYKQYPWTIGFQPSYTAERLDLRHVPGALEAGREGCDNFQNDDYGKDLWPA